MTHLEKYAALDRIAELITDAMLECSSNPYRRSEKVLGCVREVVELAYGFIPTLAQAILDAPCGPDLSQLIIRRAKP